MVFINRPYTFSKSNKRTQTRRKTQLNLGELTDDESYYQILVVEADTEDQSPKQHQKLFTRKKKDFSDFLLENPPQKQDNISQCLPSQGVTFPNKLEQSLCNDPVKIANFYPTARCLLQARKISQMISITWWAYRIYENFLEDNNQQNSYSSGNWEKLLDDLDQYIKANPYKVLGRNIDKPKEVKNIVLNILDGIIAREIFLSANASPIGMEVIPPDEPWIYDPSYDYSNNPDQDAESRMLILPNNRAWSGIRLALLFAGQALRKSYKKQDGKYVKDDSKYHIICEPILSTAEIISHAALQSSIESYHGEIEEVPIGLAYDLPYMVAKIPYPPIPTEDQVKREQLEIWFNAEDDDTDDDNKYPFFSKDEDGKYTSTIKNPTPPFPYIPISTT